MAEALIGIGFVILLAAISGAIAIFLRKPPVLGLLIVGAVAGPHQFGWIQANETIAILSELGAILLLFAIGLEFNLAKLKKFGVTAALIAITKMTLAFMLAYLLATAVGLNDTTALFLAGILSVSSTAIIAKILKEKQFVNREEVPLIISVLIVEDIAAVFLLAVYGSIAEQSTGLLSLNFIYSILQALLVFGLFYLVISKFLSRALVWLEQFQAEETLALSTIGLGIGLSFLAQLLGLPPSIGAFLAGNLLSNLAGGEQFRKAAHPLIIAFSAIFFISVGMLVDLNTAVANPLLIFALLIGAVAIKFAAMSFSTFFLGGNSEKAVFSGLAMLSVGEFSLLFAAQASGLDTGIDLTTITAVLVFFTALTSSILTTYHQTIHNLLSLLMPSWIKSSSARASFTYKESISSLSYLLESYPTAKAFEIVKRNALIAVTCLGLLIFAYQYNFTLTFYGSYSITLLKAAIALVALAILAIATETTIELRHIAGIGKWASQAMDLIVRSTRGSAAIILATVAVFALSFTFTDIGIKEAAMALVIIIALLFFGSGTKSEKHVAFFKK